jgi:hypothetical protein
MAVLRRTEGPGSARRILDHAILAREAACLRSTRLDRGSSRRIIVMRYPTRAYQNDHRRRRRLGPPLDCHPNKTDVPNPPFASLTRSLHISVRSVRSTECPQKRRPRPANETARAQKCEESRARENTSATLALRRRRALRHGAVRSLVRDFAATPEHDGVLAVPAAHSSARSNALARQPTLQQVAPLRT